MTSRRYNSIVMPRVITPKTIRKEISQKWHEVPQNIIAVTKVAPPPPKKLSLSVNNSNCIGVLPSTSTSTLLNAAKLIDQSNFYVKTTQTTENSRQKVNNKIGKEKERENSEQSVPFCRNCVAEFPKILK